MQHRLSFIRWTPLLALLLLAACSSVENETPGEDVLFLTQQPVNDVMQALYLGRVKPVDGCLRMVDMPEQHTVVWPFGFTFDQQAQVVYDTEGHVVGRLGEGMRLGGGEVQTLWEGGPVNDMMRFRALENCPGRYWLVGDVLPVTG